MAIEGANPNPNDPGKGGDPNPNPNPTPDPKAKQPDPAPDKGSDAWLKEKAGLVADLGKERTARQVSEAAAKKAAADIEKLTKQVQTLAGLNPKNDNEVEVDEIRKKFGEVYERLAKLDDPETFGLLQKLLKMVPALEQTVGNHWDKHNTSTLQAIEKKIAEAYGAESLTPSQVKKIRSAYVVEVENNPEFATQHERNPEKNIESFTKEWIDDFVEPGKRRAQAENIERFPRVPSGKDRNLVTGQGGKEIDVNDSKAVEDVLVGGFRAKGGQFGRR